MPRFTPVERFEDLPSPTSHDSREQYVLDFKETVDPSKWWELAKDMAAFANALGGVILVGVKEGPPAAYDGLPVEVAERIQVAYENATKDHLSPLPIVDAVLVRLPSGNVLVAVNVNAYPDQPIGSRLPHANKNGEPVPYDAWQFPLRVGRHTRYLVPAMLPMLTNPVVRRTVILLESIPKKHDPSYQNPYVLWRNPGNHTKVEPQQTEVFIESVDPARNVIEFRSKSNSNTLLRAPLDDVEAVWEARDHTWYIRVSGSLTDKEYLSNPRNAVFRG